MTEKISPDISGCQFCKNTCSLGALNQRVYEHQVNLWELSTEVSLAGVSIINHNTHITVEAGRFVWMQPCSWQAGNMAGVKQNDVWSVLVSFRHWIDRMISTARLKVKLKLCSLGGPVSCVCFHETSSRVWSWIHRVQDVWASGCNRYALHLSRLLLDRAGTTADLGHVAGADALLDQLRVRLGP